MSNCYHNISWAPVPGDAERVRRWPKQKKSKREKDLGEKTEDLAKIELFPRSVLFSKENITDSLSLWFQNKKETKTKK